MDFSWWIVIADVAQIMAGFINLAGYLPQLWKLLRSRSAEDLSLGAWALWLAASSCTLLYAIVQYQRHGTGLPLVFSATVSFTFVFATLLLVCHFQERQIDNEGKKSIGILNRVLSSALWE